MKLTILVDNNTFIDQYYHGEPAASFLIEEEGKQVLFDTGYSDILLGNAEKMGIDLQKTTHVVISHGHDDHTRGLKFLKDKLELYNMELVAHPDCFLPKRVENLYICSPFDVEEIKEMTRFIPSTEPYFITDKLVFLGQIPRGNAFENQSPIGKYEKNGEWKEDYLLDDTAIAYKSEKGLFIITGCSHSGICNIIEYAKKVCNEDHVYGVLGGFHLFENDEQLKETIAYFKENDIEKLYPSHCVSLLARFEMMKQLDVVETGVGMILNIC